MIVIFNLMKALGYYSFPAIYKDFIVFVSDDDLWRVPSEGGAATRLTANLGRVSSPKISPDGKTIAYAGTDSGVANLYIISSEGGEPEKLTYMGIIGVIGWKDTKTILFFSSFESVFRRETFIYEYHLPSHSFTQIPIGHGTHLCFGKKEVMVLGRHCGDPARWKRYRGGTAGTIWVKKGAKTNFQQILKNLKTNLASPHLLDEKIYFISDHEGIGNIYESNLDGKNLKRLTHHHEYYTRHLETDGESLIYQCGAEVYCYNLKTKENKKIPITCHTPAVQAQARFEPAAKYLDFYTIDRHAQELTIISRGHGFKMPAWKGAPLAFDQLKDIRYSHPAYANDSKLLYIVGCDAKEEEHLLVYDISKNFIKKFPSKIKLGKVWDLKHSPKGNFLALINHKNEVWLINTKTNKMSRLEKNAYSRPFDLAWSPDGKWLAYSCSFDRRKIGIQIFNTKTNKLQKLMDPVLNDCSPSFDPDGKVLYFLSIREFHPNYYETHFDMGFPFAGKPYAVTLQKNTPSPFEKNLDIAPPAEEKKKQKPASLEIAIDFDNIEQRVLAFPMDEGGYQSIAAVKGGLFVLHSPVKPITHFDSWYDGSSNQNLQFFSFDDNEVSDFHSKVQSFEISANGEYIVLHTKNKLRLLPVKGKPSTETKIGKKDGWIDLDRIKLKIYPKEEWRQMYHEAWVLQREHFWREDMSKINWEKIYKRYLPLLEKVKTRWEMSDLLWEMQGELGTSHCYEFMGDYFRKPPYHPAGFLGAKFKYIAAKKAFQIEEIYAGDSWEAECGSPLAATGVNLQKGDAILAIDAHPMQNANSLYEALENKANCKINLTIQRAGQKQSQNIVVETIGSQDGLLYRQWVNRNKEFVHKQSKGKLGYVHIPDMSAYGFAEFYRNYLAESIYEGLIVDVRANGGGHVSQLILRMLAQKVIGFDETRYHGIELYPQYAIPGTIVALTNEQAGSDGDIFSHSFKVMRLGKLIGKRTWGGVIGIDGKYSLRDGTITTQPEYSFWFIDVGFTVENYGTDPDIEVEITPEDWARGRDPQLLCAIEEALKGLKQKPAFQAIADTYPNLTLPRLTNYEK